MHNPPSILSLSFRRQPNKVARFRPEVEIEVKLLKLPQALLQKKKLDKYNTLEKIQCPLDIETLDKAAALDLATSKAVTDLRQYINSNLGYSDLEI